MWFKVIQLVIKWWKPALGVISLIALAVLPSCFEKPKQVRISEGGTYVEAQEGYETGFGCAIKRHFIGWSYKR